MDSFNTKPSNRGKPTRRGITITVGRIEDVVPGQCVTVDLPDGGELALYNVDGEFHATSIFVRTETQSPKALLQRHTGVSRWYFNFDLQTRPEFLSDTTGVSRWYFNFDLMKGDFSSAPFPCQP